jgi:D-sedoheptulose 7-phosphate isomerase
MQHAKNYFSLVSEIAQSMDLDQIDQLAHSLKELREREGRLFILGVGGSAGNAGHAVNDFRKLCGIETYAPTDNVSELTARTNDEGWETVFKAWLITSRLNEKDAILVLSVGGGNKEKNVSTGIISALDEAKKRGAKVFGILGKDGGYTAKVADIAVVIPPLDPNLITPISEAFQGVVWHCLVSHPDLQTVKTKW